MEKILSGKPIAGLIKARLQNLISGHSLSPVMRLIQAGHDPASEFYVQNIINSGSKLGCKVDLVTLPADCGQTHLIDAINAANADASVNGIMVQKPLPRGVSDNAIGSAIDPGKDLDCLNPVNLGRILLQEDCLLPCTPLAVLCTLRYYAIPTEGVNTVIIGRSSIVGKPLANMLLWKKPYANSSVTVCHSQSLELAKLVGSADIVVAAMGKAEFVTADMIRENSVLIDVGINAKTDGSGKLKYVGDIDYNSCLDKALAITPVPGGIGSVTTSLLFLNLVKAALAAQGTNKTIDDFLDLIFNEKQ